jgi:hypothetical protein
MNLSELADLAKMSISGGNYGTEGEGCDAVDLACLLKNKADRTLVYGYSIEGRRPFHLYLKGGVIHLATYDPFGDNEKPRNVDVKCFPEGISLDDVTPHGDVYPHASDFEFCDLLRRLRASVGRWCHFNEKAPEKAFYGLTPDIKSKEDVSAPVPLLMA